ncbi:MAG: AAA family ATPase [Planctomycetes bacterium]|nr:AAA family ATPase [Planctomycetota bacterium]
MTTATSSASATVGPADLPPEIAPCIDLTARVQVASGGRFAFDGDPKAEAVLEGISRALCRRSARHVLLTGEPGVGQTMVLGELASRLATDTVAGLSDRRVLLVDCRYTAPEQSRQRLFAILSLVGSDEQIVAIDGFAALMRSVQGTNKAVLFSALSSVGCRIIGLITPHEYQELFSDDPATRDFFSRVEIEEPDVISAKQIVSRLSAGLARQYELAIDHGATDRAVVLSHNYILNERLPGKALRILTRVCEDLDYERAQLGSQIDSLTADHVIRTVSDMSGVPEETLRGVADQADYERSIGQYIVGQEHAVHQIAGELSLIKSGLTDKGKPATVMLFVGQTGVGKTEMAKVLARFYSSSKRLKTYTLGNFIESHSVSGIIGVPPGYVGHEQGGRLVNELNADPYGVFLLDEADKTHPDVLQPFLNLFDEGWIRDQRGVTAYADKSIFILTTNVGQRMLSDLARQGATPEVMAEKMKEALTKIRHTKSNRPVFTPEFLARLKRIVVFQPLTQAAMLGIARKLVAEMQHTWFQKREKRLTVAEELIWYVADEAHRLNQCSDGREGGRIVRRLLADLVETPLQREIQQRSDEYRTAVGVTINVLSKKPTPRESPQHGNQTVSIPPPSVAVCFV